MENQLSAYADYSNIKFNIYNFSLIFGSIEDGKIIPMGKIKMSPESAKELLKLLESNVETYEEIYGEINEFDEHAKQKEKEAAEKLKKKKEELEAESKILEVE